ncbi:MAG: HupE/UreJ family protein [Cyclobacteriaceae bacterium]
MSEFSLYFQLGMEHILDKSAYDHMAFVIALAALYQVADWKKVLILVTAFTIGHSVTLALATLKLISVNMDVVEFLIPLSIFFTALSNLFVSENSMNDRKIHLNYLLALIFGLIHGLGFSNYLQAILGKEESITAPLFAFNVGLEAGQIIIVGIFLLISFIFVSVLGVQRRDWKIIISSMVAGVAFTLTMDAVFW